jgi:hypothetical protein
MEPVYKVLDGICSILECIAFEYFGEAKGELMVLSRQLETDPSYAIEGKNELASDLRQVLAMISGDQRQAGISKLVRTSRTLWKSANNESHGAANSGDEL